MLPFLKMGLTCASFQFCGSVCSSNDFCIIIASGLLIAYSVPSELEDAVHPVQATCVGSKTQVLPSPSPMLSSALLAASWCLQCEK